MHCKCASNLEYLLGPRPASIAVTVMKLETVSGKSMIEKMKEQGIKVHFRQLP